MKSLRVSSNAILKKDMRYTRASSNGIIFFSLMHDTFLRVANRVSKDMPAIFYRLTDPRKILRFSSSGTTRGIRHTVKPA